MRILALILVLLISFQSILAYSESLNTKNLTQNSMQNSYEKKDFGNIKSKIENIEYREREPGEYRMGYDNTLAWWNPDWHFRIRIEVTSQDFERHDFPVELTINFSAYLAPLSVSEPIDLNSIRIIEYVTDVEDGISLPIGYKNSHAILINSTYSVVKIKFIMNDTTKKNESRLFYVYFDTIKFPKPEVVIENKRFIHGNTKTLVYGVGTLNDWLGSEEDFGNGSLGLNGWLQIALAQGIISSYQWANPPSYFGFVSYNQAVVENLSSSDYGIFIYDIS
ncbi:MAG: hypothetical protein QXT63_03110, partial [Thermoplasmata archaeon]